MDKFSQHNKLNRRSVCLPVYRINADCHNFVIHVYILKYQKIQYYSSQEVYWYLGNLSIQALLHESDFSVGSYIQNSDSVGHLVVSHTLMLNEFINVLTSAQIYTKSQKLEQILKEKWPHMRTRVCRALKRKGSKTVLICETFSTTYSHLCVTVHISQFDDFSIILKSVNSNSLINMYVQFRIGSVYNLVLTTRSKLLYKFVHILQTFVIPQKHIKCGFLNNSQQNNSSIYNLNHRLTICFCHRLKEKHLIH